MIEVIVNEKGKIFTADEKKKVKGRPILSPKKIQITISWETYIHKYNRDSKKCLTEKLNEEIENKYANAFCFDEKEIQMNWDGPRDKPGFYYISVPVQFYKIKV